MNIGDRVKWATPLDVGEASERFFIREINGDRCIIEFECDMAIRPTRVAMLNDLDLADDRNL